MFVGRSVSVDANAQTAHAAMTFKGCGHSLMVVGRNLSARSAAWEHSSILCGPDLENVTAFLGRDPVEHISESLPCNPKER